MSSIQLLLSVVTMVTLLTWGGYGILLIQTSPSEQGAVVDAVLSHESEWTSGFSGNGTSIRPGAVAQFILDFKTNIPPNIGTSSFLLPNDGGVVFSPILWTVPTSNETYYEVRYAVFTFSFCSKTNCFYSIGQNGNGWLSGPQGNISQFTSTNHYAGLGSISVATVIVEVPAPGNYTLHYWNNQVTFGNYTGKVAMGPSSVLFSRSRPYTYAGWTTIAVAAAFAAVMVSVSWRRYRVVPQPPGL